MEAQSIKKALNPNVEKTFKYTNQKNLEWTFIEINQDNKKLIVECIYRHPSMDLSKLNNYFHQFFLKSSTMKIKPQFSLETLMSAY